MKFEEAIKVNGESKMNKINNVKHLIGQMNDLSYNEREEVFKNFYKKDTDLKSNILTLKEQKCNKKIEEKK